MGRYYHNILWWWLSF